MEFLKILLFVLLGIAIGIGTGIGAGFGIWGNDPTAATTTTGPITETTSGSSGSTTINTETTTSENLTPTLTVKFGASFILALFDCHHIIFDI
jgi:hypothetical protein